MGTAWLPRVTQPPSNDDPVMEVVSQPSLRSDAVVDVMVEDEPVARISV